LTEWRALPAGVFIATNKFTGTMPFTASSTNTLTGTFSVFTIYPFPNNLAFPFPAADAVGTPASLPYIGFSPLGQLTTNRDEYIPLDRGSVLYPVGSGAVPATPIETPAGNAVNDCNIIHIDWLTARAKIERNQQR
jgi:hypothetical protein